MKKIPAKNLMVLAAFGVALVSCGGDSFSSESSGGDTSVTTATASADPTTTVASDASGSTTTTAAPTTTPPTTAAPRVLSTECLLAIGEGQCIKEITLYEDAGCPSPKKDDLMATTTAIMPCEYGYWVYTAEAELARQGYAVQADGYYSSTEIDAVKKAQSDAGVEADGEIGPATWSAVMKGLKCDAPDDIKAPILQGDLCWGDMNSNGIYDPGDMIPD